MAAEWCAVAALSGISSTIPIAAATVRALAYLSNVLIVMNTHLFVACLECPSSRVCARFRLVQFRSLGPRTPFAPRVCISRRNAQRRCVSNVAFRFQAFAAPDPRRALHLAQKAAKTRLMTKRVPKTLPHRSAHSNPNSGPHPSSKRSLRIHGTIARQLGINIISGRYAPGDILEGEVVSSEQLAVSRTAYREALRILAAKGLIDARPKIGTRINPRSKWNFLDTDVLEWIFDTEPEAHILNALFELRDMVEPAAAALAASRRTQAQLLEMRRALEDMRVHTLATEAGQNADLAFHATLLAATHNPFLVSLATSVGAAIHITTVFKQRYQPLRRNPMPDHERVYEAIVAKEPTRARAAMRGLIRLARFDTASGAKRRLKWAG